MADALLIIDFQNDFTPGGALPVPDGDRIAAAINALAHAHDFVVATRDWHPPDHGSFEGASVDEERWEGTDPPGTWPVHCVAGSEGAELHPDLDRENIELIVDKGQDPNSQGYSGFQNTNLAEVLRRQGAKSVAVAGLATDYCVKNTALDALREGFDVTVVEDAIKGVEVNEGDSERAIEEMKKAGAKVATSEQIVAAART